MRIHRGSRLTLQNDPAGGVHSTQTLFLQPNLNAAVFLSTFVSVIGSNWKIGAKTLHDTRFQASLFELVLHRFCSIQRECFISFASASAVREPKEQNLISRVPASALIKNNP